jgi:hypothetical protein
MKRVLNRAVSAALIALGLGVIPAYAVVVPEKDKTLSEKSFRAPELTVPEFQQRLADVPALAAALAQELEALGVQPDQGFFDSRSGRWSSLILSEPLIPGTGYRNELRWVDLLGAAPRDENAVKAEVWNALSAYLQAHQTQLRVDMSELGTPRIGVFEEAQLVQVHVPRVVGGYPVRNSGLTAIINHGNLILLGLQNWGDVDAVPAAGVSGDQARSIAAAHVSPRAVERVARGQRLELVPALRDGRYAFRLVWAVPVKVLGDLGTWEALVDAGSGELLAFEDKNLYAQRKATGGVYPVSNDQRPPDGVEQVGWPMPFLNVTIGPDTVTTATGGTLGCATGSGTTALAGPFIRMSDNCGAINETSTGDFDLGSGPTPAATDCVVPVGHSAGDTKSSRSGFYELNRQVEQAKGWLPTNDWLFNQLTANMNIVSSCNAFWNGSTVNFYRDSAQCRNTGEIAAIFDHEWGHGMDNNGVTATISEPGEAIADIHAMLRLKNSCVGRGFWKNQTCGGYGDPCDGTPTTGCTGVRDLDFMNHRCNQPHTITWAQNGFTSAQCGGTGSAPACPTGGGTPCGRETHCEGMISAEVGWDLYARDLQAAPFNFDSNTALELAGRLAFLGSQTLTNWYTCSVGGGCGATNGYPLFLAADDDNGNLNDGTPHMTAIRAAFERHEIHCATPAPVNSGCAGGPTTAPTVTATPTDSGISLSWTAVAGASRYYIFRAEGVGACDFGKVKAGEATGTTFTDTGLLNGRAYSYVVLPVGSNLSCFGRASACTTATPVPGPNLAIRPTVTVTTTSGDGDEFLDNCENANIAFTVENTGAGTLTNVRLVAVTPITHPTTVINTPLPAPVAASLTDCAIGNGTVSITPQGMTFNESTQLRLEVTADQIAPATRSQIVTITNVESDWLNRPTETFDFDTDFDSWAVGEGTWTRAAGGASGTPFHLSSSQFLEFQCDVIRSPVIRLSATSTLSLQNNYEIEPTDPVGGPYDRANVGVVDLALGTRTVISPAAARRTRCRRTRRRTSPPASSAARPAGTPPAPAIPTSRPATGPPRRSTRAGPSPAVAPSSRSATALIPCSISRASTSTRSCSPTSTSRARTRRATPASPRRSSRSGSRSTAAATASSRPAKRLPSRRAGGTSAPRPSP